eukprot:Gb_40120 [translate_table: standard]
MVMGDQSTMSQALLHLAIALGMILACEAADTLYLGGSLTGNQTIISKNGTFQLGFVSPKGSTKWYIGIWYAHISEQTIVWVANRETPLENTAGAFNLTQDGNLALFDAEGGSVWSSDATKKASRAVIMDSGNLVMMSGENTSESVWQSFDHPGDTWLPGMKIGMQQNLTCWKSSLDPSPGLFSVQMDPTGASQFVLTWKKSVQYWESGLWNGEIFSGLPEMATKYIYDFSFVTTSSDTYFIYSVKPQFHLLSRFVMDKGGEIRQYTWIDDNTWNMFWSQPRDQCEIYDFCGPYGMCSRNNLQFCSCIPGFDPKDSQDWNNQEWSGGCVRRTPLQCDGKKESTDGFTELSGKWLGDMADSYKGQTQRGCEAMCLANCSCTAFAYITNATSPTCHIWSGDLLNLRDSTDGNSLFIRLAPSDLPKLSPNRKASVFGLLVRVSGALASLVAIVLVFIFWWRRRKWPEKSAEAMPGSLRTFTYKELQIATKNFSHRLGGGGFGSVFKGSLPDKTPVAVKKLEGPSQGEKQFRMEVSTIGTIQHVNLVRLRGFCSEGSQRLLVYDYMPNGSLNSFLFKKSKEDHHKVLDWKTRFEIALGTARGIVYLHEKCRDCIIHCDIKPENILLDANFCPKVADFGLAKLVGRDFSHVLTTMRGTRGYLAPEWLSGLPITAKADVYSFGMTLLEIIAGRRNLDLSVESSRLFFPTWAATQMNMGNTMDLLDVKLNGRADVEQVRRAAMVGGWCIQDDEDARPSMGQVLNILEGIVDTDTPPVPRSLQLLMGQAEGQGHHEGIRLLLFPENEVMHDASNSSHSN